jgi:hypothetical protein
MIELLKRWSELEPERCRGTYVQGTFIVFINDRWCSARPDDDLGLIAVQCVVQIAIEARGWEWEIGGRKSQEPMSQADEKIYKVANIWPFEYTLGKMASSDKWELTAAEALLSAYIKALEAVLK